MVTAFKLMKKIFLSILLTFSFSSFAAEKSFISKINYAASTSFGYKFFEYKLPIQKNNISLPTLNVTAQASYKKTSFGFNYENTTHRKKIRDAGVDGSVHRKDWAIKVSRRLHQRLYGETDEIPFAISAFSGYASGEMLFNYEDNAQIKYQEAGIYGGVGVVLIFNKSLFFLNSPSLVNVSAAYGYMYDTTYSRIDSIGNKTRIHGGAHGGSGSLNYTVTSPWGDGNLDFFVGGKANAYYLEANGDRIGRLLTFYYLGMSYYF